MISKEIQEVVSVEAEKYAKKCLSDRPVLAYESYVAGATSMAEKMEEFAEWCEGNFSRHSDDGLWYTSGLKKLVGTTSKLLTIFIKLKQ